jgi:DNA polymerase elongation subunit (family B)
MTLKIKPHRAKILILDFETSPAKGYFFGSIWETNIIEVIEYEQIISVAWKWYGERRVNVVCQNDFKGYRAGILNDKNLIEFFIPIIDSADIVIAHNGDNFDLTVFNTRLLANGFKPVSPNKSFDTKKLAKNKFHFPSNKLDDISDFLGIGRKIPHTGKNLWLGCEAGNKKEWKLMKKYNKQDVILLNKVTEKLIPFMKQINDFVELSESGISCPNPLCHSFNLSKHKKRFVMGGYKQQYQCKDCGSYWTNGKTIKFQGQRNSIMKTV